MPRTSRGCRPHILSAALALLALPAFAADPPASADPPSPAPAQLEPGVQTSTAAVPAARPAAAAAAQQTAAPGKDPAHKGVDRLQLDTSDIKGNRELPKVMYVVPWKRSDLGDLVGRPVNSLLDEVLQPLDRDVFRRENRYYDALQAGGSGAKSDAAQGSEAKP